MRYSVVGLKQRRYLRQTIDQHGKYGAKKAYKYVICMIGEDLKCYELELWDNEDLSHSGYAHCVTGHFKLSEVDNFGNVCYIAKEGYNSKIDWDEEDEYSCVWFTYSLYGPDKCYPGGWGYAHRDKYRYIA